MLTFSPVLKSIYSIFIKGKNPARTVHVFMSRVKNWVSSFHVQNKLYRFPWVSIRAVVLVGRL